MRANPDSPTLAAMRAQIAARERYLALQQSKYARRLELPRQRVTPRQEREPDPFESLRWAVTLMLTGALVWSVVVLVMMRWWWR